MRGNLGVPPIVVLIGKKYMYNQKARPFVKSYLYLVWHGLIETTPYCMKKSNRYIVFDVVNALLAACT